MNRVAKSLKDKLDEVFSQYIRLNYSKDGMAVCFTCNKRDSVKRMQCGHFVSRVYLVTRWDENNCRVQCVGCNMFGGGKTLDFEENLIDEIGEDEVTELKQRRHQTVKLDNAWYEEQIVHYKELVKKLGGW